MSKIFLKISIGMLAAVGLSLATSATAAGGVKQLIGHVPSVVSNLAPSGTLAAETNLQLSIGLPLRNQAAMTNLLRQLYDPSSTNYHHYLTPDEFTFQFGPSAADYQAVLDFAHTNGLTVTRTHGNRMLVGVQGKVSDVERSLHVTFRTYHHPTESRDFFAPDTEPTVDSQLPVLSIQGLSSLVKPHSFLQKRAGQINSPASGSGPGGSYMGADFRNAYAPGATLNGSGQIVGLLQFDGYFASDIQTYEGIAGLTNVPLQNVLLDGFDGTPGFNNDEVCLDIETSISMAPALAKVVVFEAGPFGNPNDILNSMAASNQIKQLSASWGYGIDATTRQIYQQFAVQGQTFLNASGDGDAWLGSIPFGSCEDPNITIVGGTTLTMNGAGASYLSEKVWNWGFDGGYGWNPDGYVGSSGGISTDVSIPFWQQSISMTNNHGSTTMRNVPDVALTGDNVFVVSSGGSQGAFGGTSCASPLWAGFMALVNQQAALNGQPSIGFLAPAVYALANTTNYTNVFHDVVVGDNTWDQSLTNYFAVPGYDLCTGLGTPNGTNFINALTGSSNTVYIPVISAPQAPWGTTLATFNGDNPNGAWFLFVQDTSPLQSGVISNGWFVTLTTANPVGFSADNQIVATRQYQTNVIGAPWNLTLAVTNYGPSYSTNVFVSDTLPHGVRLLSTNASTGTVALSGYGLLSWNVGTLAVGVGATLNLGFVPASAGIFTNVATVTADTADENPDDDSQTSVLAVAGWDPYPQLNPAFNLGTGGFHLSVTSSPGLAVTIQASTNLATGNWVNVFTGIEPFTYTNFDSTNYALRFYRANPNP